MTLKIPQSNPITTAVASDELSMLAEAVALASAEVAATSLLNHSDWPAAFQRLVPQLRSILALDSRIRLAAAGSFFDRVFCLDALNEDLLDDLVDQLMEDEVAHRMKVTKTTPSSEAMSLEALATDLAALAAIIPEIDVTTDSVSALTASLSRLDEPIGRMSHWTGMAERLASLPVEKSTVRRQRWANAAR